MTKRKADTKEEGKSKQVKTEEEEVFDATLGEITEITDMPVMGEGLTFLFIYLISFIFKVNGRIRHEH